MPSDPSPESLEVTGQVARGRDDEDVVMPASDRAWRAGSRPRLVVDRKAELLLVTVSGEPRAGTAGKDDALHVKSLHRCV